MFDWFTRGFTMVGASWAVLKDYPKLAVFPVFSGIALIGVTAVLAVPAGLGTAVGVELNLSDNTMQSLAFVALFVWYFLCTFVIVFCNAALIACALQRFEGKTPTVGSGFTAASKRLPQILGWSLVAATIGVILQAIQSVLSQKLGFIGELLSGIFSGVWGAVTYFVVPVLVTEGVGPIKAVKRSSGILRRTWGESFVGATGLGLVAFLFTLPLVALVFGVAALGNAGGAGNTGGQAAMVALGVIGVVYLLALIVVLTALGSIFRAAVYVYASTGVAPSRMDAALLQSSFKPK